VLAVVVAALGALLVAPVSAETPTEVAEEAADDGVFVSLGRSDVDEEALVAAVADAANRGVEMIVVAPRDPQPTAKAFARRLQELVEVEVAIVLPVDGPLEAYVAEDLSSSRPRAMETARGLADPARAVAVFADEVVTRSEPGRPAIIGQILRVLLLCSVVVGAVVLLETLIGRARRSAPSSGSARTPSRS
jgi:hypothetical protein